MGKRIALHGMVLFGLLASNIVLAEIQPGFYVGAGIGEASIDNDATGFEGDDTAFKVFAGYNINKYFAVEAAYFDGGSVSQELAGMSFTGSTEVSTSGLNLSLLGRAPLSDEFSVFAKVGIASYDVDAKVRISSRLGSSVTDESTSDEDLSYGLGAAFGFGDSFEIRGEYESIDASNVDFTVLSISGLYRF